MRGESHPTDSSRFPPNLCAFPPAEFLTAGAHEIVATYGPIEDVLCISINLVLTHAHPEKAVAGQELTREDSVVFARSSYGLRWSVRLRRHPAIAKQRTEKGRSHQVPMVIVLIGIFSPDKS
jgi:hypothetical protein